MINNTANSVLDFDIDAASLPFMEAFEGKAFVIHCADDLLTDAVLLTEFGRSVALLQRLGIKPVVVPGEGRLVTRALYKMGIRSAYYQGMRITDATVMGVVETVLADLGHAVAEVINCQGGRAITIDASVPLIHARKLVPAWEDGVKERADLGQVGEVERVDCGPVILQQTANAVPIVMPIGVDSEGRRYSIAADAVAGELAAALSAEKLIFLSNLPGVIDQNGRLLSVLTVGEIGGLFDNGLLPNHLFVKIEAALSAIRHGVRSVHIVDGRVAGALLLELLTCEGIGTQIRSDNGPHFYRDSLRYLHADISGNFDGQVVTFT